MLGPRRPPYPPDEVSRPQHGVGIRSVRRSHAGGRCTCHRRRAAATEDLRGVGPAAVPLPIGVLLGVFGAVLLIQARAQLSTASREATWQPRAGLRLLGMIVALVAFAVLLPILGYVVSAAALFVAAALLLGAPKFWQTVAYGWALAAIVFLVFDRLIGLSLPTGPWGF